MARVRELQENPELGEFRIHAALKVEGIELSPRSCGRILALNRALYGLPTPARGERTPKEMPFKAVRRHQYWTIDIRYLDHTLDERKIYCISILENFSRAVVASAVSRRQDLTAVLLVLYAAVRQHGAPEALVSDSGGVFRAKDAQRIIDATIDALRAKYHGRVQRRGNVLIGFSEGAFVAMQVGLKDQNTWSKWLILGASDQYWQYDITEAFDKETRRVQRVYLLTGENDQVAENTLKVGEMLKKNRVPVRVKIVPGLGHEIPSDRMITTYRRPLRWLAAADKQD